MTGFENIPLGYAPIVLPITRAPREQSRLVSIPTNTSDTFLPAPSWNTSIHYETLHLLLVSAGPWQPSGVSELADLPWFGRGASEKDERWSWQHEQKKCPFPSTGFEPVPLGHAPIMLSITPWMCVCVCVRACARLRVGICNHACIADETLNSTFNLHSGHQNCLTMSTELQLLDHKLVWRQSSAICKQKAKKKKISTCNNFWQHCRHFSVHTFTNWEMVYHFGRCVFFLSFLPFIVPSSNMDMDTRK